MSQGMGRFHVLYAIQRSGSTPVGMALAHYLGARFGVTDLGEYFNPEFLGIREDKGTLSIDRVRWMPQNSPRSRSSEEKKQEYLRRFALLKKSKGSYFLKLLRGQLGSRQESRLISESNTFFLRRRNHFEHLLSYLISVQTGYFYLPKGIRLRQRSLKADQLVFGEFLWEMHSFEKTIGKTVKPKIIYYEDFLRLGPSAFARSVGYRKEISWKELALPTKQNPGDKLSLFENPEEILSWYRASFLNSRFPV